MEVENKGNERTTEGIRNSTAELEGTAGCLIMGTITSIISFLKYEPGLEQARPPRSQWRKTWRVYHKAVTIAPDN